MIYLLDNNVLSELWKPQPDDGVMAWIKGANWLLPVPVVAEIQEGAEAAPSGARRVAINERLESFLRRNPGAVLDFDTGCARTWGAVETLPRSQTPATSSLG